MLLVKKNHRSHSVLQNRSLSRRRLKYGKSKRKHRFFALGCLQAFIVLNASGRKGYITLDVDIKKKLFESNR